MKKIEEKFEKAYDLYAKDILRHVYFRLHNKPAAEDLTQETFFKAWQSLALGKTKEIKNFRAFFYKIAHNLIIDYYRSKKPDISLEKLEEEQIEAVAAVAAEQEREADLGIEKEKLEKHLHELKEEYRQILVMRFIDDLKVAEISEIIGKTKTNVRVTIHRALASLRKEMESNLNVKKYV